MNSNSPKALFLCRRGAVGLAVGSRRRRLRNILRRQTLPRIGLEAGPLSQWLYATMRQAELAVPEGERNGNFRHGRYTKQIVELHAAVRQLVREAKALIRLS